VPLFRIVSGAISSELALSFLKGDELTCNGPIQCLCEIFFYNGDMNLEL